MIRQGVGEMPELDYLDIRDVELGQVEKTATKVLLEHVVDENRHFRPPIDPVALAGELGVEVRHIPLADTLSGFIAKEDENVPAIIYVNSMHSSVRQRFTVAHELGHFVQETVRRNEKFETLKRETGHADMGVHPEERWANSFAAAILMPAGATKRLYVEGETAHEIAERFKVSTTAMEYRLANLGVS